MKVVCFDASTTCIGGVSAEVDNGGNISVISTFALVPTEFDATSMGFLPTKRTAVLKTGKRVNTWVKVTGETISVTEKARRETAVRLEAERHRKDYLASALAEMLTATKPDVVVMEANMSFRDIAVTRMLGEIAGIIQGISTTLGIGFVKVNVHTARAGLDLVNKAIEFAKDKDPKWLKKIDLTKETIKMLMLEKYRVFEVNEDMCNDESDALLIFDTWYMEGRYGTKNSQGYNTSN